jgi:hypothetical protein
LPPGLQKKLERGERLPPGWRNRAAVYEYGHDDPGYSQDAPEYVEDRIYRIIKDTRDLISIIPQ